MIDNKTTELLKFCEEQGIEVKLYYGKERPWLTGIPEYQGFDIDTGEIFNVGGEVVAAHDFRSMIIINTDNYLYREHHT